MRIITSFNSAPIKKNRWNLKNKLEDTVFINAYSLLTLNEFYKDVTCYVDPELYKIFKEFPCNIVKHNFTDFSTKYWVNSKFEILELQEEPFIHFDTDIFLKNKILFNPIVDLIFERMELNTFKDHYYEQIEFFKYIDAPLFKDKNLLPRYSTNCGTMGFMNMDFLKKYIKNYRELLKLFIDNEHKYTYYKEKGYEVSVVLEQYLLTIMIHMYKPEVQYILKESSDVANFEKGNEIGYIHYFGTKKYDEIDAIKAKFEESYPFWYHHIRKKI